MNIEGAGKELLLIHGLGSSHRTRRAIIPALAQNRRVIAVDLPGHGRTPAGVDSGTFVGLAGSLEAFLFKHDLAGVDMVGSSLGGRLVLEMTRRGHAGAAVALDPGGFWNGWERAYLKLTLLLSGSLLRSLGRLRSVLAQNSVSRSLLLAQLSARPWRLDGNAVAEELNSYANTATFSKLVNDLAASAMQAGPAAPNSSKIAIGWGRHDRLCLPIQAERALAAFPSARLHWFEHSGHFPLWDEPELTVRLIQEMVAK